MPTQARATPQLTATKITIPFPQQTQNAHRGFANADRTLAPETRPTTIRFSDDDRFSIEKVAHSLNMSFGEFVRWCAYWGAIEVSNELERRTFDPTTKPEVDLTGFS